MSRSRLFVTANVPAQVPDVRAACQRVIDGFRSPQLRIAPTLPEAADFAIEYDGCQQGLVVVLLVLIPLGCPKASFRRGPLCARCSDPELCKDSGDELLHACQPWIRPLLAASIDVLTGPDMER